MNHCDVREAILLRENVVNSRRFDSNPLRIHCENATKTHSEYSQRDSVMGGQIAFVMSRLLAIVLRSTALYRRQL